MNEVLKQLNSINNRLKALQDKEKVQTETMLQKGDMRLNLAVLSEIRIVDKALAVRVNLKENQHLLLKSRINPKARPVVAWIQGSADMPYEIKAHEKYGLSCNCPSWIFNQRGNRTCKHTDEVSNKIVVI